MNIGVIMPTEENLLEALDEDLLNRNLQLGYFYQLLLCLDTATTISIDGRWGSGKTFFVKQEILLINAMNTKSNMIEEKRCAIVENIANIGSETENCDIAVYYDAWKNDNDTEPIISLIYEIAKEVDLTYPFNGNTNIFKTLGSIIETISGRNVNGIIDNLKTDDPFSDFKRKKDFQEQMHEFLEELINENGNRLIVFIDELDRCKPTYAVRLLEQTKHYLCDDRITFIFSINKAELQHTIKTYYGLNFDACKYLDRFFDIPISLPPANMARFFDKMGLGSSDWLELVCSRIIKVYHFELREIIRFYQNVKMAVYKPTHDRQNESFDYMDGATKKLVLAIIVPLVIGLQIENTNLYDEFTNGNNMQPLVDVFADDEFYNWFAGMLYKNGNYNDDIKAKDKEEVIRELYKVIFEHTYTYGEPYIQLGQYRFSAEIKAYILEASSGLSKHADYTI